MVYTARSSDSLVTEIWSVSIISLVYEAQMTLVPIFRISSSHPEHLFRLQFRPLLGSAGILHCLETGSTESPQNTSISIHQRFPQPLNYSKSGVG